jgi:hypothetical protein
MACIPVAAGAVLWGMKREVVWWEWLIGSMVGFAVAGLMHLIAVCGMTSDYETWSGQLHQTTFHPRWVEEYQVAIYKTVTHTDSKGNTYTTQEFSHYETRYRTHHEYWDCDDTLGQNFDITQAHSNEIAKKFEAFFVSEDGHKSGFYSGDPNIYVARNKSGYVYPTTMWRSFENRVKAAPSLFSFMKVPESIRVFPYPKNDHWNQSDRLQGTAASTVSIVAWDQLNARLGPTKKVNVILCGFGPDADSSIAQYQQAAWVGGRKNDVVVCYGGGTPTRPAWVFTFGWTEQELAKRNLDSIFLEHEVNDSIIPLIENEIRANYVIKDWKKFDYISIDVPTWAYVVNLILMLLATGGVYYWAMVNDEDKDGHRYGYGWSRY